MSDEELRTLFDQPIDRSLDGLEQGIWYGVAVRDQERRTGKLIMACQAGVLAVAVLVGGAAGLAMARNVASGRSDIVTFFPGAQHAPSTLLFGQRQ